MGFRLSVQALLPISKKTLVYGSNDAGVTYESENEEAKKVMEYIGEKLFLKKHICVDQRGKRHEIVGPADIELHEGEGKEKYMYLIDVARLFPPDPNFEKPNSIFYQSLRGEFMRWYKKPLSSDAFSKFGVVDGEVNNKEIVEASRVLREERIPKFGKMMKAPKKKERGLDWVSEAMQERGINARYLGLVRKYAVDEEVKKQCLLEMICRKSSNYFRGLFRELAEKHSMFKQEFFLESACSYYNMIIQPSSDPWKDPEHIKKGLVKIYGEQCLSEEEMNAEYNLRDHVNVKELFMALGERFGVELKPKVLERVERYEKRLKIARNKSSGLWSSISMTEESEDTMEEMEQIGEFNFELIIDDFRPIKSSVKGMNMSSMAIGDAMRKQARTGKKSAKEKLRLFLKAAKLVEKGSRGDVEGRIKYIETRLEISSFILKNPELLKKDWSEVQKHIEKLEEIFKEIEELCEFNEMAVPSRVEYLRNESEIQNMFINRKKKGASERMKELIVLFEKVEKSEGVEQERKKEQMRQLGRVLYDTLERSSWEENWREVTKGNFGVHKLFSNSIIAETLGQTAMEKAKEDKGAVAKHLMYLCKVCPIIKDIVMDVVKKKKCLEVYFIFPGVIPEEELLTLSDLFGSLDGVERYILKNSSLLTHKSIESLSLIVPNLRVLELGNFWNFSRQAALALVSLKQLDEIHLGPSLADTECISHFSQLSSLKFLELKKCVSVERLPPMQKLERLELKNCGRLTENVSKELKKEKFPNLRVLKIRKSKLLNSQLREIVDCIGENIEEICLDECREIGNEGLRELGRMKKLRKFSGKGLVKLDENASVDWSRELVEIDLKGSENVGDKIVESLCENKMEKIWIGGTLIGEKGLETALKNSWESVKSVGIKSCGKVGRMMKQKIVKRCNNLEEFTVSNIESKLLNKFGGEKVRRVKIYDSDLRSNDLVCLVEKCGNLEELKLMECNADDQVMKAIAINTKKLKSLGVGDKNVSDKGISFLQRLHPRLDKLDISGCTKLSEEGLKEMLLEARINKFKAYKCTNLGANLFDILAETCGIYLTKVKTIIVGSLVTNSEKPTFYFPNLEVLKLSLQNEERLVKSIARLPKLRKLVALHTISQNEHLSLLKESCSLEYFEALNGTVIRLCQSGSLFLNEWSNGKLRESLRTLVLPFSVMKEDSLLAIKKLSNLVYFPIEQSQVEEGFKKKFMESFTHFDRNFFVSSKVLHSEKKSQEKFSVWASKSGSFGKKKGCVAVVTRANYEVQALAVERLEFLGYKVFAFYEESEPTKEFEEVKEKTEKQKRDVHFFKYVPTDKNSLEKAVKEAKENGLERIDVLITGPSRLWIDMKD